MRIIVGVSALLIAVICVGVFKQDEKADKIGHRIFSSHGAIEAPAVQTAEPSPTGQAINPESVLTISASFGEEKAAGPLSTAAVARSVDPINAGDVTSKEVDLGDMQQHLKPTLLTPLDADPSSSTQHLGNLRDMITEGG